MKNQNLPVPITVNDLEGVTRSLKALRQTMPFLVTLSPAERRSGVLKPQSLALAESCLAAARENRNVLPPSFDFEQFEHGVRVTVSLSKSLHDLKQLASDVQDTLTAVAQPTVRSSLQVRALIRTAAKTTPGLQLLAEKLAGPATHALGKEAPTIAPEAAPPATPGSTPDIKAA